MATQVLPGNLVCSYLVKLPGVTQEAPTYSCTPGGRWRLLPCSHQAPLRTLPAVLIDRQYSLCPTPTCELQGWQVLRQLANRLNN